MMASGSDGSNIRSALLFELQNRGYVVADDTVALRGELYVLGRGDRIAALFEFKLTALDAAETMYQGSWTADLPPRFAVLPVSQSDHVEVGLLRQAGLSMLFYETTAENVTFVDLDAALGEMKAPRVEPSEIARAAGPREGGRDDGR